MVTDKHPLNHEVFPPEELIEAGFSEGSITLMEENTSSRHPRGMTDLPYSPKTISMASFRLYRELGLSLKRNSWIMLPRSVNLS